MESGQLQVLQLRDLLDRILENLFVDAELGGLAGHVDPKPARQLQRRHTDQNGLSLRRPLSRDKVV